MEPGGSIQHPLRISNNLYSEPNQTNSQYLHVSLRYILILSSHLRLPKGLFPVGTSVKIFKVLLISSILAMCFAHINILDLINLLGKWYKLWSSSLWSLFSFLSQFFLGPNIYLWRVFFKYPYPAAFKYKNNSLIKFNMKTRFHQ